MIVTYDTLSGNDIGVAKATLCSSIQLIFQMLEQLGEEAFRKEKEN